MAYHTKSIETQLRRENEMLKAMAAERKSLDDKLATMPSFMRGFMVGVGLIGAADVCLYSTWPLWAYGTVACVLLLVALNYLIRQRGLMIASKLSRS